MLYLDIFSCLSLTDIAAYHFLSFSLLISAGVFSSYVSIDSSMNPNKTLEAQVDWGVVSSQYTFFNLFPISSGVTTNVSLEAKFAL